MADPNETTPVNPFDAVRGQIQFHGFTDEQKETILDQLDEAYNAEGGTTGRDMIDAGIASPNGFQIFNANDQEVIAGLAERFFPDPTPATPPSAQTTQNRLDFFNEQLSSDFALRGSGEVYISPYPAVADEATGELQTYTYPGADRLGETADGQPPLRSLDHNGVVYDVPDAHTLIHEATHAIYAQEDPSPDASTGRYFTPGIAGTPSIAGDPNLSVAQSYYGENEATTQKILEEMGVTQFRGAYVGNWGIENDTVGTDYGLDREHDVGVTTATGIDMTTQGPTDAVVVGMSADELRTTINAQGGTVTEAQSLQIVSNTYDMSDGNDTVHAFDGNDVVNTAGGDDRVFLGSGNDIANAGWGNNTIDGGDANLDPASDHRSDATTDWGFDTVDYTTLNAGFAPADGLSADGTARDGVLMTVETDGMSVNKGQHLSPMPGEDVDQLHNIDLVRGTARDDLTEVNGLSGERMVDGGDGVDTLRVPEGVTNNPTAGTFNGQAYDGYLEASDGSKLYYTNYENIDVPTAPTIEQEASNGTEIEGATQTIPMEEALQILHDEGTSLEADAGATGDALRTPGAQAIMQTLVENDQTELEVSTDAMNGTPGDRVAEVLRSATNTIEERGLTEEAEETYEHMVEEAAHTNLHDVTQEQSQSYEREQDNSYDMAI